MTQSITKLDAYSNAISALEAHKRENVAVFGTHASLLNAVIDAENALRDEIALDPTPIKNKYHEVRVIPQSQTFADIEVIDQMIKDGQIPPGKRDTIVKTVKRPDHVTIRPVSD